LADPLPDEVEEKLQEILRKADKSLAKGSQ
jgi:hypothetical protein